MAAIVNGNTVYFEVADANSTPISDKNVMVVGILISSSGGVGEAFLGDNISAASYPTKLHLDIATNTTNYLDLSNNPVIFPNGIRIKGITGSPAVTLIIRRPQ